MQHLPLFSIQDTPYGVETLADFLFSGLSERPVWATFLRALAQRLQGAYAAFIFANELAAFNEISIVTAEPSESLLIIPLLDKGALAQFECNPSTTVIAAAVIEAQVCIGTCVQMGSQKAYLVVLGQHDGAPLAADWREVLQALLPVLQRITPLYVVIGNCERRRLVAEHVLETSGIGVVLVDSDARIIMINAVARSIVAQSGVACIVDARLRATRTADHKLLMRHIRQKADEQSAQAEDDHYAAFALEREGSPYPLTIIVRPGPSYAPVSAPLKRTAMVIMRDPARRGVISAVNLERLFDLTPAEARLASLLADGLSMTEAAVQLGVRRTTVRSQLQSIFIKTGTNRQGDLVRLLLSSAASLSQQDGSNSKN